MKSMRIFKHLLIYGLLIAASGPALAADVGVSISIGQPGFYGRIDIGDYPYPQPRLIYSNPIIVHRNADVYYEPLYLRVPPGHAKKWRSYCGRYNACGHPVYFVEDSWYRNEYAPVYRERHGNGNGRYDRGDDHHGHGGNEGGHGNGRGGNGHGNGKGNGGRH